MQEPLPEDKERATKGSGRDLTTDLLSSPRGDGEIAVCQGLAALLLKRLQETSHHPIAALNFEIS